MILNDNDLYFAKIKPEAKIPSKRDEDAGYDIYPCFDEDYMIIRRNCTVLIPTGIASVISPTKYIQIQERGSTGSIGMKYGAGVIDSGYRGEWFIAITNCNDKPIIISKRELTEEELKKNRIKNYIKYPYTKAIAQAVVHEVPRMNIKEISYEDLLSFGSERMNNKLGSSNK